MPRTFFTASDYTHEHTFMDGDGDPIDLDGATVEYEMRTRKRGGTARFAFDDDDSELTITDAEGGVATVDIDAADLTVTGSFWEEWRLTEADGSSNVRYRQTVRFRDAGTSP